MSYTIYKIIRNVGKFFTFILIKLKLILNVPCYYCLKKILMLHFDFHSTVDELWPLIINIIINNIIINILKYIHNIFLTFFINNIYYTILYIFK